jgi:O-acetyl-ADP-ribose deacetylase (regulator of RNase III)
MTLKIIHGNIFTSDCQTWVNAVNCEGVMGAGIALEYRLRYPSMFQRYQAICQQRLLVPGKLWIWRSEMRWVLNFPTKQRWKQPSRLDYLEQGLHKLQHTWQAQGIRSLAIPLLGADRGGLPEDEVQQLIVAKLSDMATQIPVHIYHYDANASDELYQRFAQALLMADLKQVQNVSGIGLDKLTKLHAAVKASTYCQINQLANIDGIGEKTLEKVFHFCFAPTLAQQGLDL